MLINGRQTDESEFNVIFNARSHAQLKVIFEIYTTLSKYPIAKSIEREFSGNIKKSLLTIGL